MRKCPKCHEEMVADDGYCGGGCGEITMPDITIESAFERVRKARAEKIGRYKKKPEYRTPYPD